MAGAQTHGLVHSAQLRTTWSPAGKGPYNTDLLLLPRRRCQSSTTLRPLPGPQGRQLSVSLHQPVPPPASSTSLSPRAISCTSSPSPLQASPTTHGNTCEDQVTTVSPTYVTMWLTAPTTLFDLLFQLLPLPGGSAAPSAPCPPNNGTPPAPLGPFLVYTGPPADLTGSYTTHPLRAFHRVPGLKIHLLWSE